MTEFRLTPNDSSDGDENMFASIFIFNPIMLSGWNLKYQHDNNKVYMNYHLGLEPGQDYLSSNELMKTSCIYLYLDPYVDLSKRQYLIVFKTEKYSSDTENTIEIYHNGDRVATEILEMGDDRFAVLVDATTENEFSHIYFRVASGYPPFWFKEIEVQVI